MDRDDNDFQNQNFQIGGEDNTKFPPGLRSYALPKFDVDEHLQVHLRFDSLVETEVLLDIQGQEDNRWIEDYSHESSGIEFNSGAANSCSISLHNNVWSEAASSETVEMLLNSMGQDEMITKQTNIGGSKASDGLDPLINQMEPSLSQVDSVPSKRGVTIDSDPTLPPDKCLKNLPGSSDSAAGCLPYVQDMPQTHTGDDSGLETLMGKDTDSVGEKVSSYTIVAAEGSSLDQKETSSSVELIQHAVTDEHLRIDRKLPEAQGYNQPFDGSMVTSVQEGHCSAAGDMPAAGSGSDVFDSMQVDSSSTSAKNLVRGSGEMNIHNFPQQVVEGCSETAVSDKLEVPVKEDDPQTLKTNIEMVGPEQAVESCTSNLLILSSSEQKVDCTDQIREQQNEVIISERLKEVLKDGSYQMERCVSSRSTDISDHLIGSMQEASSVSILGDKTFGRHSIGNYSHGLGSPVPSVSKMDSMVQISKGYNDVVLEKVANVLNDRESGSSLKGDVGVDCRGSKAETIVSLMAEKEHFKSDLAGNCMNDVDNLGSSSVEVHSPTDLIHETPETVKAVARDDNLGPQAAIMASALLENAPMEKKGPDTIIDDKAESTDTGEMHCSSSLQAKSSLSCDGVPKIGSSDADIVHSDVHLCGNDNAGLSDSIPNDIDSEVDGSLIVGKKGDNSSRDQCLAFESLSKQNVQDESVLTTIISGDTTGLASVNKLEDVSQIPSGDSSQVGLQKDVGVPPLSDSIQLAKEEETIGMLPTELSSSVVKGNWKSHPVSGVVPVSDTVRQTACNSGRELLSKEVLQTSPLPEKFLHSTCQNEPQASPLIKMAQGHAEPLEQNSVPVAVMKKENASEASSFYSEKYEETALHVAGKANDAETPPVAVPSSADEYSHVVLQSKEQDRKTSLGAGAGDDDRIPSAGREGDALNSCKGSSIRPTPLPENTAPNDAPEAGNSSPNNAEPDCGSRTVISSTMISHNEKEYEDGDRGSLDKSDPVSDDSIRRSSDIERKASKNKFAAHDPKENYASEDDRSFTFEVGSLSDLSDKEAGKGWRPFSNAEHFDLPQAGKGAPTIPGLGQTAAAMLQEASYGSYQMSGGEKNGDAVTAGEDKHTVVSDIANERGIVRESKPRKKKSGPKYMMQKDGNICSTSGNSVGSSIAAMSAKEIRQSTLSEGSNTRACSVPAAQTSVLPDLNSSASTLTLFHQPFTDLQQVQLRAQIFVYGSLIQCIPPDEACMISAFGGASRDGGRSEWERIWRVSVERFQNQKSPLNNPETPLHSRSGVRLSEQASRFDPLQGKPLNTPAGRTSSKGGPSTVFNSPMPPSSPLWSVSMPFDALNSSSLARGPFLDPHQTLSPLHPYQSPHLRQYGGNSSPWLSQVSSPAPRVVSPRTPALGAGAQYSAMSIAEAVQVASVRDSSSAHSSIPLVPPSPLAPNAGGSIGAVTGSYMPVEPKKITASSGKHMSADQKPRKRKKSLVSEEHGQIYAVSKPRTEPPASGIPKPQMTSISISSPAYAGSRVTSGGFVSESTPFIPSSHFQIVGAGERDHRVIFSEETGSKIEQTKLHAEEAASLAASAVSHNKTVWDQLAIQKNSGLGSETGAKLASAATAAAAAAAVAKAAAAAAKVAADAALQAKLMADEALVMPRAGDSSQGSEAAFPGGGKNLDSITSASILKGKAKVNSSTSVIGAARVTARKRVEAASAAAKRAENLDAVLKAAELAAVAVSQSGTIIAMGDPLPFTLSDLIEAGPEGYWKVQASSEHLVKANSRVEQSSLDGAVEGVDRTTENTKGHHSYNNEKKQSTSGKLPPKEILNQSVENSPELVNGMHLDSASGEKRPRVQRSHKTSDVAKTVGVTPVSEVGSGASFPDPNDQRKINQQPGTLVVNNIKEGSIVEVVSDEDGLRGVWFSARVLSVKDGKAYVCYNELLQDEGSDKLKEWIAIEAEGGKAPRIRVAHPMTSMKFEGTRKRRREAMGNYSCSVGDRVDALIRDGWREGIITEKGKEDETKLTVHFPAGGDSLIVRAWEVRPSVVWKDGQWVEWSGESNSKPHEGDTPHEKRQRMGRAEVGTGSQPEAQGKDKPAKDLSSKNSRKPEESWSQMLSSKDKIFNFGKTIREDSKSDALKIKRTGLQKEGSKVVFGVPKPGKKRKFMEVSKQFVAESTGKASEGTNVKFTKYLMPQSSRGWKNTSKVDSRGKRAPDSKPKVQKSVKSQNVQSKTIYEKDKSSIPVVSAPSSGRTQDPALKAKDPLSYEENISEKKLLEVVSFSKAADDPVFSSSLEPASDASLSKQKSSSAVGAVLGTKGKVASAGDKSCIDEEKAPDSIEPRRSNRRIQPTSRLLEGLQSSLIVAKIPPISHEKGAKARNRAASSTRGNNN